MADEHPTVNEEQLAVIRDHVQFQREELAEQREKNRAEEAIEMGRIKADGEIHAANLSHAGKVLDAQANDRQQIRTFWDNQLGRLCWLVITLVVIGAVICSIAIFRGETEIVFKAVETIATHAFALAAGIGADRIWVHRKKAGISSPDEQ